MRPQLLDTEKFHCDRGWGRVNRLMRWRVFLIISLGLNLAFALAFVGLYKWTKKQIAAANAHLSVGIQTTQTNVVVRRQFFTWREVESADYPTYIANLRAIGCPESTIRDIIVADVNQLYARKRAEEIAAIEQQWWSSEAGAEAAQIAEEKLRALDAERRALLTRLLGPDWEITETNVLAVAGQPRATIALDGPVLGALPAEVKEAVQTISARSQQRIAAYINAQKQAGKEPDPVELARLRQQTRDELASVLTPPQLEEYLLRYSENARQLRAELAKLQFFNATPEEFRNLFRVTDLFDQQIKLFYSGDDRVSTEMRRALEQQREQAIKNALGPKRYAEYRRLQDPVYREAMAAAIKAGAPESVDVFYAITVAAAQEAERIRSDTNLTAQQREIELRRLELDQLRASTVAAGQELPPEPPPLPPPMHVHVIQPGETIDKLAARYGVSIREVLSANSGVNFNTLKPGDTVLVPLGTAAR